MSMTAIPSIRASTSLDLALAHAITFLTRPLTNTLLPSRVIALQHALSSTLTPHLATSWCPADPSRGSGRRCLTFAPGRLPSRPIYTAAKQAGIEWGCWIVTLGGREFDLFIDPGRVRVRFAGDVRARFVWSASASTSSALGHEMDEEKDLEVEIRTALRATMARTARAHLVNTLSLRTDLASCVSSDDDDHIPRPSSRASSASSSPDSDADSLFSVGTSSSHSSATSLASFWPSPKNEMPNITLTPAFPIKPSASTSSIVPVPYMEKTLKSTPTTVAPAPSTPYKISRRERARQRRAGVITLPPAAPIAYDGGKTTVLGGGVRLGGVRAVLGATRV